MSSRNSLNILTNALSLNYPHKKTRRSGFLRYLRINDYSLSERPDLRSAVLPGWQMRLLQSPRCSRSFTRSTATHTILVVRVPVPAGIRRPTITFSFRPRNCRVCPQRLLRSAREWSPGTMRGDEGLGCQRRFGDTQQIAG